jgi:hypothetical protein
MDTNDPQKGNLYKFNGSTLKSMESVEAARPQCHVARWQFREDPSKFVESEKRKGHVIHVTVESRVQYCRVHFPCDGSIDFIEMDSLYELHSDSRQGQPAQKYIVLKTNNQN